MASISSRGRGRRTMNEINMVPFIDVMLVLMIIFMVTAPLITPSMINLPSVGRANKQPAKIIQVVIAKDGALQIKTADRTVPSTMADVANLVIREQKGLADSAVIISADRNVKYETVVNVMGELQKKGAQRVGLAVQVAPGSK